MILDAGFLISVDRGEDGARAFVDAAARSETALHTTHPVLGQVWRNGTRQARLSKLLQTLTIHPLDNGQSVGTLLARSQTSDVVDAHLVMLAVHLEVGILTGDPSDLTTVSASLGPAAPAIHPWP